MAARDRAAQALDRIIGKAVNDAAFRRQLIANPRETIERELGVKLPENLMVDVVEAQPNQLVLALRPLGKEPADASLSDSMLGAVSGGGAPIIITWDEDYNNLSLGG